MFKKITSAFIVIAILASMFSFMGVFAADNLISSESFEDGIGTWVYWGKADVVGSMITSTSDAKDGKKALNIKDDSDKLGPGVNSPRFSVKVGETYKATLDYKAISGKSITARLRFLDAEGKKVADSTSIPLSQTEWTSVTVEGVAPEGAVEAVLLVVGIIVSTSEVIIDNAKIYGAGKTTSSESISETATSKPKEETPFVPSANGNIIFEEDFEGELSKWEKPAGEVKVVNGGKDSAKALYLEDADEANAPAIKSVAIPAKAGVKYTFIADTKITEGISIRVYVKVLDADKKQLISKSFGGGKEHDWKTYSLEIEAPENAAYILVHLGGANKDLGKGYIDNIKITTSETATTPSVKEETKLEKINKSSIVLFIGSPNALVNGKKTLIDATNNKVIADTVDGRTLVPVRFIAENYGAEVGWDDPTQTVTLKMADKTVTIVLNKKEIDISGKKVAIDVPAQTIQDRTMLPLRAFVEQVMGKTIFWDDRGLIVITDEAILDAAADKATIDEIINNVK